MMMETVTAILVFKTNLVESDLTTLDNLLSNDPRIKTWNVDLDDCDRVLRIESTFVTAVEVQLRLKEAGYFCEELPD